MEVEGVWFEVKRWRLRGSSLRLRGVGGDWMDALLG